MTKRMKYIIKSCPSDDTQGLQNLLNEMSENGWELYSMNEVETPDEKIMFNCIFMSEEDDLREDDSTDIMKWGTVKNPIEKMLSPEMTPYEKCVELISKIKTQKKKISEIKAALDVEDPASVGRKKFNDKISSSIKEFENLKKDLAKMSNPSEIYKRLGVDVLCLFISEELVPVVDTDSEESESLWPELIKMRYDMADESGYIIPPLRIMDSENLAAYEFLISIRGVETIKACAYPHYMMYFLDDLNLTKKLKGAIYDVDIVTGDKIIWVEESKTKDFWANGMKASEFIIRALNFILVKYVDEIFGYEELERYCQLVESENPFLVENIVPDVISFADLRYILVSLLRERVSIKDIVFIFEKMNDYAHNSTRADLLSKIRLAMSRLICGQYQGDDGVIRALEFSDNTFAKIVPKFEEDEVFVKIDTELAENLAKKIIKKSKSFGLNMPILVVPMEFRQLIFNLFSQYINNIVVLANEEIGCNYRYEIVGEI